MQRDVRSFGGIFIAFLFAIASLATCFAQTTPQVNATSATSLNKLQQAIDADNTAVQDFIAVSRYKAAEVLAHSIIKRSATINYKKGEGYAHINLSAIHYATRHFSEA